MQLINKPVNPSQLQLRKAKHNLHAIHGFSALVTTSSTQLSSRPFSFSLSLSPSKLPVAAPTCNNHEIDQVDGQDTPEY
jgi:hypothetical protein